MLNNNQKEKIRKIMLYEYALKERDGLAIDHTGKNFLIPTFPEIREIIFKQILELGFSKIEIVAPNKANCIIRVFQKLHYKYDSLIYNLYGAHCFTLKSGKWISTSISGNFEIDYSDFYSRHWLFQDEYIDFDLDFFDCYVKIS